VADDDRAQDWQTSPGDDLDHHGWTGFYIRSGGGMERDWPKNLIASGEALLRLGGVNIPIRARQVTDPDEARMTSKLVRDKYHAPTKQSKPGEPLTKGEQAVFELSAADRN
jgi:hypothetical protein